MNTLKSSRPHHHHHNNHHYDLYSDVGKIKEALMETTQDIKGKAGEMFNDSVKDIKGHAISAKDKVENYTAEKPFKSLGIALLAGMAIGFLLRK